MLIPIETGAAPSSFREGSLDMSAQYECCPWNPQIKQNTMDVWMDVPVWMDQPWQMATGTRGIQLNISPIESPFLLRSTLWLDHSKTWISGTFALLEFQGNLTGLSHYVRFSNSLDWPNRAIFRAISGTNWVPVLGYSEMAQ